MIHLPLLEHMMQIWRLAHKQLPAERLPVVIPMVLYHGRREWKTRQRLAQLLSGQTAALVSHTPDFRYLFYDLSRYADKNVSGSLRGRIRLLVFKHIFDPDMVDRLPEIFKLLEPISKRFG